MSRVNENSDPIVCCTQAAKGDYSISGLRVRAFSPGAPWALTVHSPRPLKDWIPLGTQNNSLRAPSTVVYQGEGYGIVEVERRQSDWVYRLQPWPSGELWRNRFDLSPIGIATERAEEAEFRRIEFLTRMGPLYEMWLGWIPASIQEHLSRRWHFSPEDASRRSVLIEFLCGFGFYLAFCARLDPLLLAISFILCADGLIRWAHTWASDRPIGLIPIEIASRSYSALLERLSRSSSYTDRRG